MPDRKKILHELDHQVADADWCDNDWKDNVPIWVLRGALGLLREQEPVEPHLRCSTVYMNGTSKIEIMCGNCGLNIPLGKPNYCPWCGRAVKWE